MMEGLSLNEIKNFSLLEGGLKSDLKLEFKIVNPFEIGGDFKFRGKSLTNSSRMAAQTINLDLSETFSNQTEGEIRVKEYWGSISKHFDNNQEIFVEREFQVEADSFDNKHGASISTGPMEIYLKGNKAHALYQELNSVLESRFGGIELIIPMGGAYFGYQELPTVGGVPVLVGSKLFSHGGEIHIQSGKDVLFEGTETIGIVVVEAIGKITKKDVNKDYQDGMKDNCWEESWCKAFGLFGKCVGGWGYKTHCNKVANIVTKTLKPSFNGEKFFSQNKNMILKKNRSILELENIDLLQKIGLEHAQLSTDSKFLQEEVTKETHI